LETVDAVDTRTSLEAAKIQLTEDGFPELSRRLASLSSALNTCTSCSVQGTQAQELSKKPLVTHFTEHKALLRLLLSLKGSSPSIRRRQTTFQSIQGTSSNQQQAITSNVFAEAPNPDALFDLHGTCVLLPSEIFSNNKSNNTSTAAAAAAGYRAHAPETELAELSQGLQARPSWAPASVQGLPPLHSGDWLPISPTLLEMRGDSRKIVPPTPLNVPLSTLAIERTPGAVTGFSSDVKAGGIDKDGRRNNIRSIEDDAPVGRLKKDIPTAARMDKIRTKDTKTLLGSGTLWTLEESQLARDALLSLQGVYSSLLRLRGALAAAHALPHPAAAGILKRIERAASCRHRLQGFIDAFGSHHRTANSSTNLFSSTTVLKTTSIKERNGDPMLSALAAGLSDILLSSSQRLSSLETSHATEWVHTINLAAADGGPSIRGKVLQGQGLSLTRVAVLTGKVQTMLRVLSSMFWCNDVTRGEENSYTRCEWEMGQGPPRGPALLSLLCRYAEEAEEPYKEIFQYLFARAAQPYLLFLQQWACTTTEIDLEHPYSVLMPSKLLATAQPETFEDFAFGNKKRNIRRPLAIPGNLPEFLSHIEAPLLRAGVQLRLLHSIRNDECRELVAALSRGSDTDQEDSTAVTAAAAAGDDETDTMNEEDVFKYSLEAPPVFNSLSFGVEVSNSNKLVDGDREKFDIFATAAAAADGGSEEATSSLLLLPHTPLQIEGLIKQNNQQEVEKTARVDTWLKTLERERQAAEAAERGTVLGALTLATEAIALKELAKMEALNRTHSQKQELLKEQLEAIASVHLARGGGVPSSNGASFKEEEKGNKNEKVTDVDVFYEAEQQEEQVVDIDGVKQEEKMEVQSNSNGTMPVIPPGDQSLTAVPISTTIETTFTSRISLQYRLVSHACLSFFIDHLQLGNHLSFLRGTFFLEAGDWADEFLKPLSSRIVALHPLSAHSVHGALQDSLANSSLGKNSDFVVLGQNLEGEILAGPTAISSFFTCLERQQQESNEKIVDLPENLEILATGNLPRNRASAPVLVSPTALDGLDIVLLRYKTSWPLAALLTEDTSLAYAAIFSAMLRVRKVSAALTKIWVPLAPRLSEAPTIRPSEKTTHRVQKLRVFVRSASQFTAAVQYFQGLTTAGPTWAALKNAVIRSGSGGANSESTRLNKKETFVSDLQELLEMHRTYVFTSAIQCLTICGKKVFQNKIDAALHAALTVASKIETAVEAGRVSSGPRSTEASWVHTLSNDTTWHTIETSIIEFESAVKVIKKELVTGVGVSGPLAGFAAVL